MSEGTVGERRHFAGRPRLLFHWTPQRKWIGTPDGTGTAFDPRSDPFERNGRRTAAPEGFADVARAGAPREKELDDAAREALGALGYLDDAADATAGIPAPDAGTAP